jgi:hypothetical protein
MEPENGGCGGMVGLGILALPETKFEPFTVSVNAAPFGLAVAGLRLAISGVFVCVGNTVNGAALMVMPPPGSGLETVTSEVPGDAMSEARTVMAICPVAIFTVAERAEPFQNAVEVPVDPAMKPLPAMKTVKDWLPAVTLEPGNSRSGIRLAWGDGVPVAGAATRRENRQHSNHPERGPPQTHQACPPAIFTGSVHENWRRRPLKSLG